MRLKNLKLLFITLVGLVILTSFRSTKSARSVSGRSNCAIQSQGDINCNGTIGLEDFEIWRKGYLGITGTPTGTPTTMPGTLTPTSTPNITRL